MLDAEITKEHPWALWNFTVTNSVTEFLESWVEEEEEDKLLDPVIHTKASNPCFC